MDPIYLHFVTFLTGLLVGNWLAIGRDRRTTFNENAQRIREKLLRRDGVDIVDIDLMERLLPFYRRSGFRKALNRYYQTYKDQQRQDDSTGEVFYADQNAINSCIDGLVNFTHWR